jgi:hypothetical protein
MVKLAVSKKFLPPGQAVRGLAPDAWPGWTSAGG